MNESPHQVLDARQIKRIEAVHGGFLYQHLYAVGWLFLAAKAGASALEVERVEDIEISTGAQRVVDSNAIEHNLHENKGMPLQAS